MNFENIRKWYPWGSAGFALLILLCSIPKLVQWNNEEHYQIIEFPNGEITVIDTTGFHAQWFGEVFTYPRYVDTYFSKMEDKGSKEDTSIRVTFNDGGWGNTSNHLKFQMPVTEQERIELHRHFGEKEVKDVTDAIGHHLVNCLKNSGPLMSGSEHQSQRKSEFYQAVFDQLRQGLFVMERVEQKVAARGGEKLNSGDESETQFVTRIKRDTDGKPVIAASSPLSVYGITVIQYNQTGTVYDDDTVAQISAKRNSYQLAEEAKAGVQKEYQKLLEVVEKGRLAVAEVEAQENKLKKGIQVKAQQEQDVARILQKETVTKAEQAVGVAGENLKQAKTKLEISAIKVDQAKAEAEKLIAEAGAMQAKLNQGGALSERDKQLAEFKQKRDAAIAQAISQIPSPKTVILGGGNGKEGGEAAATTSTLMNLIMLQQLEKPSKTVQK